MAFGWVIRRDSNLQQMTGESGTIRSKIYIKCREKKPRIKRITTLPNLHSALINTCFLCHRCCFGSFANGQQIALFIAVALRNLPKIIWKTLTDTLNLKFKDLFYFLSGQRPDASIILNFFATRGNGNCRVCYVRHGCAFALGPLFYTFLPHCGLTIWNLFFFYVCFSKMEFEFVIKKKRLSPTTCTRLGKRGQVLCFRRVNGQVQGRSCTRAGLV